MSRIVGCFGIFLNYGLLKLSFVFFVLTIFGMLENVLDYFGDRSLKFFNREDQRVFTT